MAAKAETGVVRPQVQGLLEPQEGAWPCHTSISDFWPQNCRRINSVVFNHLGESSGGSVLI